MRSLLGYSPAQEVLFSHAIDRCPAAFGLAWPFICEASKSRSIPIWAEHILCVLQGSGRSLDPDLATRMGDFLGYDLTTVRIHIGPAADDLNRHFGSRAFAWGSDIFFARDAYDPESAGGRELIAHEVIHVIQQSCGRVPGRRDCTTIREGADIFEVEAELLATLVGSAPPSSRRPLRQLAMPAVRVIQRDAGKMVTAAQTQPPGTAAGGPHTCHEAALGWAFTAEKYSDPWELVAEIKDKLQRSRTDIPHWIRNIYTSATKLSEADVNSATPHPHTGDVLFTKDPGGNIWHSMVVVSVVPNHVYIRGFNNAGTFNYLTVNPPAPPGAYDASNRDVADTNLWHGLPHARVFGKAIGTELPSNYLWLIPYDNLVRSLKTALSHWTHSSRRNPNWQHTGGPPCFPHCPH
jgi:hypothetical protein